MFKEGTRDYIVINKQDYASRSYKKGGHHFVFTKSLLKEVIKFVQKQRKLGKINVRKIKNSFRFIDDLLSLNDNSNFEKNYKDISPTELELKKENNSNS